MTLEFVRLGVPYTPAQIRDAYADVYAQYPEWWACVAPFLP
jgi:hypothetical protein